MGASCSGAATPRPPEQPLDIPEPKQPEVLEQEAQKEQVEELPQVPQPAPLASPVQVVSPRYVCSVEVHNNTDQPIAVSVLYEDMASGNTHAEDIKEIPAGESLLFDERQIDMGSWQAVAPVKHVQVGEEVLTPVVDSVVGKLQVHYNRGPDGPALVQGVDATYMSIQKID